MTTNPRPATSPPCCACIIIYCYIPHPQFPTLEHPTAPFNQLHQLLRQYLVYNHTPIQTLFQKAFTSLSQQLQLLASHTIPHLLPLFEQPSTFTITFPLQQIQCHYHRYDAPPWPYPTYNLADYISITQTLPPHIVKQLQNIHSQHTCGYPWCKSGPLTPASLPYIPTNPTQSVIH